MSYKRRGWIVLERTGTGRSRWVPLYETARRTRLGSQLAYRKRGEFGAEDNYWETKKGYLRCVPIHTQEDP